MDQNILINLILVIPIIIMLVAMTLSQKRKNQKDQELRNSIKIGDKITTIGGIIGTVVSINDESFVIRSKSENIEIKKWSVAAVDKSE